MKCVRDVKVIRIENAFVRKPYVGFAVSDIDPFTVSQ